MDSRISESALDTTSDQDAFDCDRVIGGERESEIRARRSRSEDTIGGELSAGRAHIGCGCGGAGIGKYAADAEAAGITAGGEAIGSATTTSSSVKSVC